jgi:hypothetical protein
MALTKVTRSGITDDSINADKIEDGTIVDADITPGTLTAGKLASTLDLSSKTVTLPNTSVTNAMLAGSIANAKLANSAITVNGAAISLGGSVSAGSLEWQAVKTSGFTAVAGEGYFCNTNGGAFTATLPASPSAGDTVAFKDYGDDFGTNALTIARNGSNIQGVANNSQITTDRASVVLVYIDATKGWLYTNESNVADLQLSTYISATGGTVLTVGDYKTHVFTGDADFVVSVIGNPVGGPSVVDYLVVAGGGDGTVGGGGGGGLRSSNSAPRSGLPAVSPLDSATGITVTTTTYPVTVGASNGNPSNFSTITSAGGGSGPHYVSNPLNGGNGGSGGGAGGAGGSRGSGGSGNTPPVSPPQGNNGGNASGPNSPTPIHGGAGGGATSAGGPGGTGTGGTGAPVATDFFGPTSPSYGTSGPSAGRWFAGGGGSGTSTNAHTNGGAGGGGHGGGSNSTGGFFAGTINTGGGGGGSSVQGGPGGSGFVAIRYKFQN